VDKGADVDALMHDGRTAAHMLVEGKKTGWHMQGIESRGRELVEECLLKRGREVGPF